MTWHTRLYLTCLPPKELSVCTLEGQSAIKICPLFDQASNPGTDSRFGGEHIKGYLHQEEVD